VSRDDTGSRTEADAAAHAHAHAPLRETDVDRDQPADARPLTREARAQLIRQLTQLQEAAS
jgi:hypothetical protein